jgi:cyclopropane-fatty-acyl-phospholipid synthase
MSSPKHHPPRGATSEDIEAHYDLGNDFYGLWLDEELSYSCALWDFDDPTDTLEQAQTRKLEYHIERANVSDGGRILDVGCGWGSLLRALNGSATRSQATGLTLSRAQADWILRDPIPSTDVRIESWFDHAPTEPYDGIISIGAFEHFADPSMDTKAKVNLYRDFFSRCSQWLVPGGRMSLQTIAYGICDESTRNRLSAMSSLVFPGSELPTLEEIVSASEGLFKLISLRDDSPHYAKTCQAWRTRLRKQLGAAEEKVGRDTARGFFNYLAFAGASFTVGNTVLYRITLEKPATLGSK